MKILYATLYSAEFGMGGAERVLYYLAQEMKGRYQEQVACALNAGIFSDSLSKLNLPVYEIPHSKIHTLRILRQFQKAIGEFKPDIIHSHHRYTSFLLTQFFKNKAAILHTEHVMRRDKRFFFRYGHMATAVHESVRQNLIRHYGVPAENVFTFPNAVPPLQVDANRVQELRRLHAESGKLIALCIGRLEEQKGQRYLIGAVAKLPDAIRQKLMIVLAGEGSMRRFLEKEAAAKGVSANFVFLGHTTHVGDWLEACDFTVLPSLYEGLPLSVLEAYAAGKGVVATDIDGTREIVKPGMTGMLVRAADESALSQALEELIKNPGKIRQLNEGAKSFAREFSFNQMIKSYHDLYMKLLQRKS